MTEQPNREVAEAPLTMTIQDVARHYRVRCLKTVRKLIKEGDIPPPDLFVGKRARWLRMTIMRDLSSAHNGEATHQEGKGAKRSQAGSAEVPRQDPTGASRSHSTDEENRHAG